MAYKEPYETQNARSYHWEHISVGSEAKRHCKGQKGSK